jgi:hypothetical protein
MKQNFIDVTYKYKLLQTMGLHILYLLTVYSVHIQSYYYQGTFTAISSVRCKLKFLSQERTRVRYKKEVLAFQR